MIEQTLNGYQVMSDGNTVWVNGPQGESVARFTANKYLKLAVVDVHADLETQRITGEQCLACEHGEPTRERPLMKGTDELVLTSLTPIRDIRVVFYFGEDVRLIEVHGEVYTPIVVYYSP